MKQQSHSKTDGRQATDSGQTAAEWNQIERRGNIDEAARYVVEGLNCRRAKSGTSQIKVKSKNSARKETDYPGNLVE